MEENMFKRLILTMAAVFMCSSISFAMSGLDIMKKSEALTRPKTAKSTVEMTIYKGGDVTKRKLKMKAIDGKNSDRALLEVVSPFKMKILTHTHKGREDQQWLKQKNGKIKKIISSDRKKPIINSHFFYEDLKSRDINDSNYKLAGNETVESFDCHKIIATPKKGKSVYKKAIIFVRKSDYFIMRSDIFYKGYLYKRLINYDIRKINGILTPKKAIMYRLNKSGKKLGKTIIEIKKIKYNDPKITARDFNKSRL